MISERANDGIERSREQWFKRYNAKHPEKGGTRKTTATKPRDWLQQTREDWADQANEALERSGSRERITEASFATQYFEAAEAGDEREMARLQNREPGVHSGPHNVARAERGGSIGVRLQRLLGKARASRVDASRGNGLSGGSDGVEVGNPSQSDPMDNQDNTTRSWPGVVRRVLFRCPDCGKQEQVEEKMDVFCPECGCPMNYADES